MVHDALARVLHQHRLAERIAARENSVSETCLTLE